MCCGACDNMCVCVLRSGAAVVYVNDVIGISRSAHISQPVIFIVAFNVCVCVY